MASELENLTNEWKEISDRDKAKKIYDEKIMPLNVEEYIKNNEDKVPEKVDYLIVSVGTSYEPIELNIKLLQPEKILFLYTPETQEIFNLIKQKCELKDDSYSAVEINETDTLKIYKEIKERFMNLDDAKNIFVDFTGGTKAMSVALAMAGMAINARMLYVHSNFLKNYGKSEPGSEELLEISNPMEVFGDIDLDKVVLLYDHNDYSGAIELLSALIDKTPIPEINQQSIFTKDMAEVYESWITLDFKKAYEVMNKLIEEIEKYGKQNPQFLAVDLLPEFEKQKSVLEHLIKFPAAETAEEKFDLLKSKDDMLALIFTMYTNAEMFEKQKQYDVASLLLYRTLEMIGQRRLAYYNLDSSDMDYDKANYKLMPAMSAVNIENGKTKQKWLLEQLEDLIKAEIKKSSKKKNNDGNDEIKNVEVNLPEEVSLLDGFRILFAIQDGISEKNDVNGRAGELQRIRGLTISRNNSIFAHGYSPVTEDNLSSLKTYVAKKLSKLYTIEQEQQNDNEEKMDYDSYKKMFRRLSPSDSKNYTPVGTLGK